MAKGSRSKIRTVFEISAGGVLYKKEGDSIFVLLISVKNGSVWTLPKGLKEKGEDIKNTAIREVKEETGCTGKIVKLIDKVEIWFYSKQNNERVRHHKLIYYYLMKYISGDPKKHDFEVDSAKWFLIDDAIKAVTYKKDKEILEKAKEMIYADLN